MKLFNHVLECHTHARRSLTSMVYAKRPYYSHFVWWKFSILWGQPHLAPMEIHSGCGGLVHGVGEDYISYCEDCAHICEGETEHITTEEWERAYA